MTPTNLTQYSWCRESQFNLHLLTPAILLVSTQRTSRGHPLQPLPAVTLSQYVISLLKTVNVSQVRQQQYKHGPNMARTVNKEARVHTLYSLLVKTGNYSR